MELLTVAAKANWALLLPALLAVTYLNEKDANTNIAVEFQDVESLDPKKGKVSFQTGDSNIIYDDAIILYLRNSYKSAQTGNPTLVREASFPFSRAPLRGTSYFLMLSIGRGVDYTISRFDRFRLQIFEQAGSRARCPSDSSLLHNRVLLDFGGPRCMGCASGKQCRCRS